jgi:hypothetical protein
VVHCIVYFSTSVRPFENEDILNILHQSRQHNAQADISGMLLYMRGNIIQVLEGDKQAVLDLFGRIETDHRHTNVACVLNKPIEERLFADWNMGYQTTTSREFEAVKAIIDIDKGNLAPKSENKPAILKTLNAFYRINHQV